MIETIEVPLDELEPHPKNAKTHDIPLLRESLRRFGQYRAIVVQKPAGRRKKHRILAGHGTFFAAREEGWGKLDCHPHDIDDETALRIVAIDNRSTELGGYNDQALAEMLSSLPDLETTGYTQKDLDKLVDQIAGQTELPPADEVPIPPTYDVLISCDSEQTQVALLERLTEEGYQCRALLS